jgi:hypothetical protein
VIEALEDLRQEPTVEKLQQVMEFASNTAQFGTATAVALPYILAFLQTSGDLFNFLFPFKNFTR